MSRPDESRHKSSRTETKSSRKESWKKEKDSAKTARRREKLERKLSRRSARQVVAYKSLVPRTGAIALLEDLIEGLKSGRVSVEHEGEQLQFTPAEEVRVRVSAKQTYKREGILVRVSWPRVGAFEESPSVRISAGDEERD